MTWLWVAITVITGSAGDLLSAHGMAQHGVIEGFTPSVAGRVLRFIFSHKSVVAGIVANAVSFISFLALLSVSDLNFAVPATALGYIVRTVFAKTYLHEKIGPRRWAGAMLVAAGVILVSL
jgi:transporter family protein